MNKLAIYGGSPVIKKKAPHFTWPLITRRTKNAVRKQLETSISIYNRSGIFEEFENRFAKYHNRKYALVTNSGTSALFGAYEALNLGADDEVICPAYTFFATISPLMYFGAKPRFCDCSSDGNIDPNKLLSVINKNTRALVITHMWGTPCNMDEIESICHDHKLSLIEDCSHAHGARYKGRLVGTFGDIAIWSLQGQKIVTGGEGGILLTDNYEYYVRAVLQGQYNKRCFQEIDTNHPLHKFALTGFGLKLRAHPLAIAIANEQFDHLELWLEQKNQFAKQFIESLKVLKCLKVPKIENIRPSWYAFVMQYHRLDPQYPTLKELCEALWAEGLCEIDHPSSTRPIYNLPLFTQPYDALTRLYRKEEFNSQASPKSNFSAAEKFYQNAIKIPMWVKRKDEYFVKAYIKGILKVGKAIETGEFKTQTKESSKKDGRPH